MPPGRGSPRSRRTPARPAWAHIPPRAVLGLHALQNALDEACAEVVGVGRCQATRVHDRFFFAVVDATTNYLHVLLNPLEQ